MPRKIAIVFHNGSNYHYRFIIMELAEEFIKKQFICLEENTEKYTTFTVSIENEVTRIDKMDEKFQKICYILQFIESARFMTSSLSNFVNNLSERIHRIKFKFGHNDKICEAYRIKYKYCDCFLEYTIFQDNLREYKCVVTKIINASLTKSYKSDFLINTNFLTATIISLFSLLLKDVYPYKYLDYGEKLNETSLPENEDFYIHLNIEDITDPNCLHACRVCKD